MEDRDYSNYEEFIREFKFNIPDNFNFAFDVVDKQCEIQKDKVAIIYTTDEIERQITYNDIKRISDQYAYKFKKLDIGKGDRVIVRLGRNVEWFLVTIALMKVGAIICPCPDMVCDKEFRYRIECLDPKYIIDKETIEVFKKIQPQEVELKNEYRNGDTMLSYFTSGSTGTPKMIDQHNLLPISALPINKYASEYTEDTICMNVAEFGWIMHLESFWALFWFGCTLVVYDYKGRLSGRKIKNKLIQYKVDNILAATPVFYMLLLEGIKDSHLKISRCGGAVLHKDLFDKWEKETGMKIKNFYGQTEFPHSFGNFCFCECRPTTIGKLLPGIYPTSDEEFNIHLGDKRPLYLSCNDFGEVYKSGDIINEGEDGYFYFHSRIGDMINSSGYRFTANEIEEVLMKHEDVQECLVYGVPDIIRDELAKAEIVLKEGVVGDKNEVEKLKSFIKEYLAAYKCPKFIEFVSELEKTNTGKIKRKNK